MVNRQYSRSGKFGKYGDANVIGQVGAKPNRVRHV
jgi:hypothetical protein